MMKNILLGFACVVALGVQAIEYEVQFENTQISVAKVKIEPHEEIGLHRDALPQVVIALKGGIITRLEADGQKNDVKFPTGVAVVRDADPENALHKSLNNSDEPIELIIIQLKNSPPTIKKRPEKSHDILLNIQLNCPKSEELQEFLKSIPPAGQQSSSYEEWKTSFVNNMNELIHLVESKKVFNSWWSVHTNERTDSLVLEDK